MAELSNGGKLSSEAFFAAAAAAAAARAEAGAGAEATGVFGAAGAAGVGAGAAGLWLIGSKNVATFAASVKNAERRGLYQINYFFIFFLHF